MFKKTAFCSLLLASLATPAFAGGDGIEPGIDDPADGPPFFGEVIDLKSRKTLVDALVRAEFGKGQVILTRTDPEGRFRFSAFGRTVDPNSVKFSCSMKGFKAVDLIRTPGPRDESPIELKCLLEPG